MKSGQEIVAQISGLDKLLSKFNIYPDNKTFTVKEIKGKSNEAYAEILHLSITKEEASVQVSGAIQLLSKLCIYPENKTFTVQEIIEKGNEAYAEILGLKESDEVYAEIPCSNNEKEEMEITPYIVGVTKFEKLGNFITGYLLEYNEYSGLMFYAILPNPTEEERKSISESNDLDVALTILYDCMFLSIKFKDLPWGDCCFEPNLYKEELTFPNLEERPEEGLALNIFLVDSARGGLLTGMRAVGLGRKLSLKFIEYCKKRTEKPFTEADKKKYHETVDYVHRNFTSKELIKLNDVMWKLRG